LKVVIDSLMSDQDFRITLTRPEFEELCKPVLGKVQALIETVVAQSSVRVEEIDCVEIVGGGTLVPSVQQRISAILGGKEIGKTLDLTSSIAEGSALFGYLKSNPGPSGSQFSIENPFTATVDEEEILLIPSEVIAESREKEARMKAMDELLEVISNKKNVLEGFIYATKETANSKEMESVFNDTTEKNRLLELINITEDWLFYGDGAGSSVDPERIVAQHQELAKSIELECPKFHQHVCELEEQKRKEKEEAEKAPLPESMTSSEPKTDKQRLAAAIKKKDQGNTLFKEGDYSNAARRYSQSIAYLDAIYEDSNEKKTMITSCSLNIAACYLQVKDSKRAITYCDKALQHEAENVKALFRRAKAYTLQKDYDLSRKDLKRCEELQPGNKEILSELARVKKLEEDDKKKQKKMYAKMFG